MSFISETMLQESLYNSVRLYLSLLMGVGGSDFFLLSKFFPHPILVLRQANRQTNANSIRLGRPLGHCLF